MEDLAMVINPDNIQAGFIPDRIQHYPIMNSKLSVLRGEESKRVFDYRVVITNPNAISEKENTRKEELNARLQQVIADKSQSEDEFNQELEKINDYFTFEWQDSREIRANALLSHYTKEYNIPFLFNMGFMDGMIVGEEIYQCDIVGGEPTIEKINPLKIRVFKSGYSNRIEDAGMIVIEDYWSPSRVIDTFYDSLSRKDIEYIEKAQGNVSGGATDSMDNVDERQGFVNRVFVGEEATMQDGFFWDPIGNADSINSNLAPFDALGNIRVIRVYWKSLRKIKKVKSYDPMTGEELFNFYPETYILKKDQGEEEEIFWINEAWEGTKIGSDIYVNMRPRVIQYNRLSNPSRCHFGIIGSIYNINDNRPFSLVDMMKPYNYLYDVIHDRLNKLIAKNWGKIITLDLAKVPEKWDVEKWLYFAKTNNIAVVDSFKEGNKGAATGKLAGGLNNASSGVIDAELGNTIQQYTNLLEFIKMEMSEVAGITKQREGQVANRETVGGVERATLQSSHITEYLFLIHDDVKKRTLEAFLETAKIALKGRSKKFQYLLSDGSIQIMNIDGDEFAEADYGLVVDNSNGLQELQQKMDMLAQAALQNQILNFSTIMKLYNSSSLAEKQRLVEKNEAQLMERQQQMQQQQIEAQQQQAQMQAQLQQAKMEQEYKMNSENNETKIIVAEINSQAEADRLAMMNNDDGIEEPEFTEEARANLLQKMKEFDSKLKLERDKLEEQKRKNRVDESLKARQIKSRNSSK